MLRSMHSLGIRFISLAGASCTTPFAKASTQQLSGLDEEPTGLTDFGEIVLQEMNRMGILAEISKMSEEGMILTLLHSKAPVLIANSAPTSHCNSSSVPDHIIRWISTEIKMSLLLLLLYIHC